jgi:hypothetical protein
VDWGSSAEQTNDDGFIIAGWTESFGFGEYDMYLIKTNAGGSVQVAGGDEEKPYELPFHLAQNRPNPFREATSIAWALPGPQNVTLSLYDVRGALVRLLASGTCDAGRHEVVWDGRDGRGREAASGIYFYSLETAGVRETRRLVLLR